MPMPTENRVAAAAGLLIATIAKAKAPTAASRFIQFVFIFCVPFRRLGMHAACQI
jgi:hypothetical protein